MGTTRKPTKAVAKRPPAKRGKPVGLPTALLREVPGENGATVHDVLVQWLRVGVDVVVAAGKAYVSKTAVYDWLHAGAVVALAVERGAPEPEEGTYDAAVLRFAHAAHHAIVSAEAEAAENVARLGAGIIRKRTSTTSRTTKDGTEVVSITETEEDLGPNLAANVFLLERRTAERWTRRQQIEVTMGDSDPDAAPEPVLPKFVAMLQAIQDRTAETERLLADG